MVDLRRGASGGSASSGSDDDDDEDVGGGSPGGGGGVGGSAGAGDIDPPDPGDLDSPGGPDLTTGDSGQTIDEAREEAEEPPEPRDSPPTPSGTPETPTVGGSDIGGFDGSQPTTGQAGQSIADAAGDTRERQDPAPDPDFDTQFDGGPTRTTGEATQPVEQAKEDVPLDARTADAQRPKTSVDKVIQPGDDEYNFLRRQRTARQFDEQLPIDVTAGDVQVVRDDGEIRTRLDPEARAELLSRQIEGEVSADETAIVGTGNNRRIGLSDQALKERVAEGQMGVEPEDVIVGYRGGQRQVEIRDDYLQNNPDILEARQQVQNIGASMRRARQTRLSREQAREQAVDRLRDTLGITGLSRGEDIRIQELSPRQRARQGERLVQSALAGLAGLLPKDQSDATERAKELLDADPSALPQVSYQAELTDRGRREFWTTLAGMDPEDRPTNPETGESFLAGTAAEGTQIEDTDRLEFDDEGNLKGVEKPESAASFITGPPGPGFLGDIDRAVTGTLSAAGQTATDAGSAIVSPVVGFAEDTVGGPAGEVESGLQFILGPAGQTERSFRGGVAHEVGTTVKGLSMIGQATNRAVISPTAEIVGDLERVVKETNPVHVALTGELPSKGDLQVDFDKESDAGFRESAAQKVAGGLGRTGTGVLFQSPKIGVEATSTGVESAQFAAEQVTDRGVVRGLVTAGAIGGGLAVSTAAETVETAARRPYRTTGQAVGGFLLAPAAGVAAERATTAARLAATRARTIGSVDLSDVTSNRVVEAARRGDPDSTVPLWDTSPTARTSTAVREARRRAQGPTQAIREAAQPDYSLPGALFAESRAGLGRAVSAADESLSPVLNPVERGGYAAGYATGRGLSLSRSALDVAQRRGRAVSRRAESTVEPALQFGEDLGRRAGFATERALRVGERGGFAAGYATGRGYTLGVRGARRGADAFESAAEPALQVGESLGRRAGYSTAVGARLLDEGADRAISRTWQAAGEGGDLLRRGAGAGQSGLATARSLASASIEPALRRGEAAGRVAGFQVGRGLSRLDDSDATVGFTASDGGLSPAPGSLTDRVSPLLTRAREAKQQFIEAAEDRVAAQRSLGNGTFLLRSDTDRLPEDFPVGGGTYEIPGLYGTPELSLLRSNVGGGSRLNYDPRNWRLPRPFGRLERTSALDIEDFEGMPSSVVDMGKKWGENPTDVADADTSAARFMLGEAEEGVAYVPSRSVRSTELEAVIRPGTEYVRSGTLHLDFPGTGRGGTMDLLRRVDPDETDVPASQRLTAEEVIERERRFEAQREYYRGTSPSAPPALPGVLPLDFGSPESGLSGSRFDSASSGVSSDGLPTLSDETRELLPDSYASRSVASPSTSLPTFSSVSAVGTSSLTGETAGDTLSATAGESTSFGGSSGGVVTEPSGGASSGPTSESPTSGSPTSGSPTTGTPTTGTPTTGTPTTGTPTTGTPTTGVPTVGVPTTGTPYTPPPPPTTPGTPPPPPYMDLPGFGSDDDDDFEPKRQEYRSEEPPHLYPGWLNEYYAARSGQGLEPRAAPDQETLAEQPATQQWAETLPTASQLEGDAVDAEAGADAEGIEPSAFDVSVGSGPENDSGWFDIEAGGDANTDGEWSLWG